MADPDQKLNPSERNYKETFERPHQGNDQDDTSSSHGLNDSSTAQDLKHAEENTRAPENFYEGDGKDAARRAEAKQWNAPENRFGYKAPGHGDSKPTASTRRKNGIKLGAAGGAIGIALFLAGTFLPLKIPGIMQMISDEAAQRVEQITEKRAKMMVGRYIINRMLGGPKFVITGKGPVSTLMASMRTARFEDKLAARGITIEGQGKNAKLLVQKEVIFTAGDIDIERGTVTVVQKLDGSTAGRKALNDAIKEEIPSWRWMKRAKFAKWLRLKYGIPRYGIENSKNSDEKERVKEMQRARLTPEYEGVASTMGNATECTLEANCATDPYNDDGSSHLGDPKTNEIGEDAHNAVPETVDANVDPKKGSETNLIKTMIKNLLSKVGAKAIPFVGWIDLVATVDHFAYEATMNDYFGKLSALYRSQLYSRHYGVWSGYGSQIQLGSLDPEFISVLATQTEGIEESQAFNMIEGNAKRGKPVENKINQNNPGGISKKLGEWNSMIGGYDSLAGKATHWVLDLWYKSIGGLLRWASELLGTFIASVTPEVFNKWMANLIAKVMTKLFEIMGIDFDPMVKGADWFNAAHGGATWTYNNFCKVSLGCRLLSPAQTAAQNNTVAVERAEYRNEQGLFYSLFSTDNSASLTNQLAIHTPTNVTSAAAKAGRIISDTPARLLGLISGKTSASAYVDIHGVDAYGALASELAMPIDEKAVSGEDCEESDGKKFNHCVADKAVAEMMLCEFKPDEGECAENDLETSDEGLEFTVGSYNVLHSENHTPESKRIGGCNNNPVPDDPNCAKTRAALQFQVIKGEVANIPQFDIFGTQEMGAEQYNIFKTGLEGYDVFPDDPSRMSNQQDGAVALFWNTDKFTKFASGKFPSLSNVIRPEQGQDGKITNPWVGLESTTGHKVYVTSVHFATGGYGGTPDKIRESANYVRDWVKSVVKPDSTVVVVGDMNDMLSQKLSYCVFTKEGLLQHARDMVDGLDPSRECPKPSNDRARIDHIYSTLTPSSLKATSWANPPETLDPVLQRASDHTPAYATYVIPASGGSTSLKFGSYNVRTSELNNSKLGDNDSHFDDDDKKRMEGIAKVVTEKELQIFSAQEVGNDKQHSALLSSLPTNWSATNPIGNSDVAVFWDSSLYQKVDTGTYPVTIRFDGTERKQVWVKLKHKESQTDIYVFSVHFASDITREELRISAARKTVEEIKKLIGSSGTAFILAGDINGNDKDPGRKGAYNIFKESGLMNYTREATSNRTGNNCDSHNDKAGTGKQDCRDENSHGSHIDQIWVSKQPKIEVSSYNLIANAETSMLSDHNPLITDLTIPGIADNDGAAGEWHWPVDHKWWKPLRADFLGPHTYDSGTWTSGVNRLAADISAVPDGEPVYAMLGGKVTNADLGGHGLVISSEVQGGTLQIAYAHGPRTNKNPTYKSGDKIMTIGALGNVTGGHLHVDMSFTKNGVKKGVCAQDVFLALEAGKEPNLSALTEKAIAPCGRS